MGYWKHYPQPIHYAKGEKVGEEGESFYSQPAWQQTLQEGSDKGGLL